MTSGTTYNSYIASVSDVDYYKVTTSATGTYYIKILGYNSAYSTTAKYTLKATY